MATKQKIPVRQDNFIKLAPRNRSGFQPEQSPNFPSLTEPGLVSPLDKILRAQQQGLPVQFNAGKYLEDDFSVLDGLDAFELYEFRENLTQEIEDRKKEFHAATKLLAEKQNKAPEGDKKDASDPKPDEPKKDAPKASNEADKSHNPT